MVSVMKFFPGVIFPLCLFAQNPQPGQPALPVYGGSGSPVGVSCSANSVVQYQGTVYTCSGGTYIATGGSATQPNSIILSANQTLTSSACGNNNIANNGSVTTITLATPIPTTTCTFKIINDQNVSMTVPTNGVTAYDYLYPLGSTTNRTIAAGSSLLVGTDGNGNYTLSYYDLQGPAGPSGPTGSQGPAGSGSTASINNAASTGTTINTLTKLTGAPSTAVIAATTDTGHVIGVTTSGAGTSGSATITLVGQTSCVFDGATTAGDYVQISASTAGNCHDVGSTYPTSGQIIGVVESTNASGGTYTLNLFPSEIQGSSGGGGTGALVQLGKVVVGGSSSGICSVSGGTLTCSSIPGTYTSLMITASGQVSDAAAVESIYIEFNSDTGTNYQREVLVGTGTAAVTSSATVASTPSSFAVIGFPGSSATSGYTGSGSLLIPGYAGTTFFKSVLMSNMYFTSSLVSSFNVFPGAVQWLSTSAVTNIKLIDGGGGNFANGSVFALYGVQ